jgi:hypothetical protein
MLNPAFNVKLGQQILSGLVVTGKFDGMRIFSLGNSLTIKKYY